LGILILEGNVTAMQRSHQQEVEDLLRHISGLHNAPLSHPMLQYFISAIQSRLALPSDGLLGPQTVDAVSRLDEKELNNIWLDIQSEQNVQGKKTRNPTKKNHNENASSQTIETPNEPQSSSIESNRKFEENIGTVATSDYLEVPSVFVKLMEQQGCRLVEDSKTPLGNSIQFTEASRFALHIQFNQQDLSYWLNGLERLDSEQRVSLSKQIKPGQISVPIYISTSSQLFAGDDEFRQFCDSQKLLAIRIISGPEEDNLNLQMVMPGKNSASIQGQGAVAQFYRNILQVEPERVLSAEDLELVRRYQDERLIKESIEQVQTSDNQQDKHSDELTQEAQDSIRLTGFVSDDIQRADQLGIQTEVLALCGIIAARDVEPPLSIGLFGDWGTGKSFFIKEMIQCLNAMAKKAKEVEENFAQDPDSIEPDYWSNIAQITFNAWHYEDADLWASLVVRIFDALAEHVTHGMSDPDKIALERQRVFAQTEMLKSQLEIYQQKLAQTEQEKHRAEDKLKLAQNELSSAEKNLSSFSVENIKNTLLHEFNHEKPQLTKLSKDLGLGEIRESAEAFEQQFALVKSETYALQTKLTALWRRATTRRGMIVLFGILLSGIIFPLIIQKIQWLSQTPDWQLAMSTLTAILTWAGGFILTCKRWLTPIKQKINALLALYDEYEQRSDARLSLQQAQVLAAQELVLQKQQKQASEQKAVLDIQAKITALTSEIELIRSGRLLRKFLENKQSSNMYRGKLGIVSSIRDDFNQLSEILSEQSSLKRARWAEAGEKSKRVKQDCSKSIDGGFADVDRIVLYIDDLDRCAPQRVVEILRAVHLLLAFKLFVVIVAVDSRWLLNSLKLSMRNLAGNDNQQALKLLLKDNVNEGSLSSNLISTPQNYLEKIFQIPYTIPDMTQTGVGNLLRQLSEPLDSEARAAVINTSSSKPEPKPVNDQVEDAEQMANKTEQSEQTIRATADSVVQTSTISDAAQQVQTAILSNESNGEANAYQIKPNSARSHIKEYELACMAQCWRGFSTPRAINRFVNTYRLLRSMVESKDQQRFFAEEQGEYQAVILLLAILIALPNEAEHVFIQIKHGDPNAAFIEVPKSLDPSISENLASGLDKLAVLLSECSYAKQAHYQAFQYWLPLVARFSFRPMSL
jgi:hypothetical protein